MIIRALARGVVAALLSLFVISCLAASRPAADTDGAAVAEHVLNRIAFGPRPGDVARVRAMGVRNYIETQLHPENLDDGAVDARLAALPTLRMDEQQIVAGFERPLRDLRHVAATTGATDAAAEKQARAESNAVVEQLAQAKLLRAVYSERQLEEVLTDFWFNHFNVDSRKGIGRYLATSYERDVIRPHVLGRFRDLLEATAHSPAMLYYLDNWMSTAPPGAAMVSSAALKRQQDGLNENYARELLELHTLGVDGGYSQHDVVEVARAFSGWTIEDLRDGPRFHFDPRMHDDGAKTILGLHLAPGGGEADGECVLDLLAAHPATAQMVATALVRRFVSDTPPPALVARVAARFRDTGGDLREVTRTVLLSPEFLAPRTHRAKLKTPFEFVASLARASGAEIGDAAPWVRGLRRLGEPLYQCQPPTGYKDTSEAWINTGTLLGELDFVAALGAGEVTATRFATPAPTREFALAFGAPSFLRR